eukprot:5737402-Alexandrium_andersonii.AAC.1
MAYGGLYSAMGVAGCAGFADAGSPRPSPPWPQRRQAGAGCPDCCAPPNPGPRLDIGLAAHAAR